MTYGQVARAAGSPRAARQVVRILHSMSRKHDLPWHRVINVKGQIALKSEEGIMNQKSMLEDEGIEVSETGNVDLGTYQFHPDVILDEGDTP
ncbi:methylated-DNA-protein-cysteine methyltransferase-like protein [Virgibacillus natechei]|uniref:Methylated-DNA-protein-cysteine methyltransferase-like protein n=2 Tax=Virgibacillus natechei TaxID=1216297 RepID=A0ABS4IH39_9BACI|nr:methylated-DNA-protein-cysteine methyltransferase-like protein [Virgibacillus natechei]